MAATVCAFVGCLPLCPLVAHLTSGRLPNKTLVEVYVVVSFVAALFW